MSTPEIEDSVIQNNLGGMTGDEIEIQFSYQDDPLHDNYSMTRVETNRIAYPQFFIETDENFQGSKMTQYYSHPDLVPGDSLSIRFSATSRRFYEYFKKVITASGSDDSPFFRING